MYVCRLDRDWTGTPFPLQGVEIRNAEDIAALARHADHVYIDLQLGDDLPAPRLVVADAALSPPPTRVSAVEALRNSTAHAATAAFEEELPRAREAQGQAAAFAARILDDVRSGHDIAIDEVRRAVEPVVRSILRNHDAFFWIDSLRRRDAYDYSHALTCSALAAAFGRHLGFPDEVLTDLASGGLLMDVGKLRVAADLFARNGPLQAGERAEVQRHVELGLAVVGAGGDLPGNVRDIIGTHHERMDGSGYPQGLAGASIPLLGRIAAIVDSFDAMTSDRSHCRAIPRHDALQELYRLRDTSYGAELVEQFMQCLGVYPTGSLVELSSGEIAVVMAQNPARRLRPRVMVLTSPDKQRNDGFRVLDLMAANDDDASPVVVKATLASGAFGLDLADLFL